MVWSIRNEILGLFLIAAYIACSTKLQFELKANNEDHEFLSLRRACKGEKICLNTGDKDMIKDVIQSKLEMNDRLVDVLSNTPTCIIERK